MYSIEIHKTLLPTRYLMPKVSILKTNLLTHQDLWKEKKEKEIKRPSSMILDNITI